MTSLTLITLAIVAFGVCWPRQLGRALAFGGATPAGAAVVVGSFAVPTFYAVSMLILVLALVAALRGRRLQRSSSDGSSPGATALIAFGLVSVLVTLLAPILFDGLPVLSPSGSDAHLQAGLVTTSNVAQVVYLGIGIGLVVFLGRSDVAKPELVGIACALTTVLSFWRYLHTVVGVPFPVGVLDNSPAFAYIETAPHDVQRFRGILSEPAALATSSLVTICFMAAAAVKSGGRRRAGALVLVILAGFLGFVSTSATFILAGAILLVVAGAFLGFRFLLRRLSLTAVLAIGLCVLLLLCAWLVPTLLQILRATINEKVATPSYSQRSGSDAASYGVLLDTWGLGAGLGANRSSSFLSGVLSTTGVIGACLFFGVLAYLIVNGYKLGSFRPVVWSLLALIVVKVISGPDLSDTSGILWLSIGVLSRATFLGRHGEGVVSRDHGFSVKSGFL